MTLSLLRPVFLGLISLALIGAGCTPSPAPDETVVPYSGDWSFILSGSTGDLSGGDCPFGIEGFVSGGSASLLVSDDAESATMTLDGQTLAFERTALNPALYETAPRSFPVLAPDGTSSTGSVYFDFVPNTSDTIVGSIHWDNYQGCQAEYPFTMELVDILLP